MRIEEIELKLGKTYKDSIYCEENESSEINFGKIETGKFGEEMIDRMSEEGLVISKINEIVGHGVFAS